MLADGGVPKYCHLHSPVCPYSSPFILLGTAPSDTAGVAGGLGSSLALLRSDTWRQQAKGKCHSVTLMTLGGTSACLPPSRARLTQGGYRQQGGAGAKGGTNHSYGAGISGEHLGTACIWRVGPTLHLKEYHGRLQTLGLSSSTPLVPSTKWPQDNAPVLHKCLF